MTSGERLKKRLDQKRKLKQSKTEKIDWVAGPRQHMQEPEQMEPLTYPLQSKFWYEFCVHRQAEYESRGMKTAALVYWSMRFWDKPHEDIKELTTAEGFEENVSTYWQYKLETVPHMFDYPPPQ